MNSKKILTFILISLPFFALAKADIEPDLWKKSIMLESDELKNINLALRAFNENIPLENLIPTLYAKKEEEKTKERNIADYTIVTPNNVPITNIKGGKINEKPVVFPVYSLHSIVYIDQNNWTIWINDQKITSKDNNGKLEIYKISEDQAVIKANNIYHPNLDSKIQNKMYQIDEGKYVSTEKDFYINTYNKVATFRLNVNQEFDIANLKIKNIEEEKTAQRR